jgi:hypothetical protein
MQNTLTGIHGNNSAEIGTYKPIFVPMHICKKLEDIIEAGAINSDLVEEVTVLRKFHITKKTLANYLSSRKIPRCDYTIAFNKSKWFFMSKLMGLKNLFQRKKAA